MQPARAHRSDQARPPRPTLAHPSGGSPAAGESAQSPLTALREAAQRAVDAAGGAPLLVLTHRSPDPDALGACVGMHTLLTAGFGLDATVATTGRIFRAENVAMVRELGLRFDDYQAVETEQFAGSLLVDTQPTFGHTSVPEDLPVVGVIDHHIPPEGEAKVEVAHRDVRTDMGSTSTLIYEYLRDAGVPLDGHTATALFCGVRFDTGDLAQAATALDEEAYYETFRRADKALLARVQRPRLPQEYYRELSRSLRLVRRHGPAVVALLGSVANPESVAEMADFFLRMEGARWSLVGGAFE
ncbi:MAG: DHH family phosphoesterase, partial [Planctomycetota bacterium]